MKDNMTMERRTTKPKTTDRRLPNKRRMNNVDILDIGFDYLVEKLGVVDAERFITIIKTDDFDYTKWRRGYFGNQDVDTLCDEAAAYAKSNPHQGKGVRI